MNRVDGPFQETVMEASSAAALSGTELAARNKRLIKDLYSKFLAGDLPAVMDMQAEDSQWWFEWAPLPGEQAPRAFVGKTATGRAEIQQLLGSFLTAVTYTSFEPQVYVAEDDNVYVQINVTAKSPASPDRQLSFHKMETWALDNKTGKVKTHACFLDTRAMEALLSQSTAAQPTQAELVDAMYRSADPDHPNLDPSALTGQFAEIYRSMRDWAAKNGWKRDAVGPAMRFEYNGQTYYAVEAFLTGSLGEVSDERDLVAKPDGTVVVDKHSLDLSLWGGK